jgi:glycosyltransferase involved in cell wall biosynthesis
MTTPGAPAPEVSIVLPAHNEVALLGSTVTNLLTGLDARRITYEIVIVENGSNDGTLQLARVLAAQLPALRVLTLPRGDYGAALAAGFAAATGTYVVNFDVDYYDLAFFDTALEELQAKSADIVVASKRAPGATDRRPLLRRLLTAGFSGLLRAGVGLTVSDAHGMKAMRRSSVAPLVAHCRLRGSLFDVELVVRAGRADLLTAEVPAVVAERRPPRSSLLQRSAESGLGVLRLRRILAREDGRSARRRLLARVRRASESRRAS